MSKSATLTVQQWGNSLAVRIPAVIARTARRPAARKGPSGVAGYILGHQPKSLDWRARNAKPHPFKKVTEDARVRACETPNQIIAIG